MARSRFRGGTFVGAVIFITRAGLLQLKEDADEKIPDGEPFVDEIEGPVKEEEGDEI